MKPCILFLMSLTLFTACGGPSPRSSATHSTGPGSITLGQSRASIESANPNWTIHTSETEGPSTTITYRDYHWSLSHGFLHSAEFHRITYSPAGEVVAWTTNNNPTKAKE